MARRRKAFESRARWLALPGSPEKSRFPGHGKSHTPKMFALCVVSPPQSFKPRRIGRRVADGVLDVPMP